MDGWRRWGRFGGGERSERRFVDSEAARVKESNRCLDERGYEKG